MIAVKYSKKIDSILDDISMLAAENGLDFDFPYEIECECFAMDNEDKCRADHFNSAIQDGIQLSAKSLKTGKPIYVGSPYGADYIFYFVDDLSAIVYRLRAKLAEMKELAVSQEDEEIQKLEEKLETLKKKKKKTK